MRGSVPAGRHPRGASAAAIATTTLGAVLLLFRRDSYADLPRELVIAVVVVTVQAAALLVTGLAVAADTAAGSPDDPGAAVTLAVLAVAVGALLFWLARGLLTRRLWARTPVVFLEVLFLPVAYTLVRSGYAVPGVAYLVLTLGVLVLLFTPAARDALEGPTSPR
jgi:uncharacterized membrane protein YhaH (DUF805 family)